ncbi:hypothetical protein [Rhodococcus pyridinivorans]|uniref:hypothetical protein n=1 Tax=Rhodococcus pyridinivorans TaxID=103816 RepID=UPI000B1883A5
MAGETVGELAMVVLGVGVGAIVRVVAGRTAGRRPLPGSCEAACAAAALVAVSITTGAAVVGAAMFGWWCVCLSAVDLLVRRLPNVLTLGERARSSAWPRRRGTAGRRSPVHFCSRHRC